MDAGPPKRAGSPLSGVVVKFKELPPKVQYGGVLAILAAVLIAYLAWPADKEPARAPDPPPYTATQESEFNEDGYSDYSDMICSPQETIGSDCAGHVATLTSASASNLPVSLSDGGRLQVFPFMLEYKQAQCFCQALDGGHLASIHSEEDYRALETAAINAGVRTAFFLGAHELSEGHWAWTDPTLNQAVTGFVNVQDATLFTTHGYYDNWGGAEDAMAYCGHACRINHGWTGDNGEMGCAIDQATGKETTDPTCQPIKGLFDWGSAKEGGAFSHFACRWKPPTPTPSPPNPGYQNPNFAHQCPATTLGSAALSSAQAHKALERIVQPHAGLFQASPTRNENGPVSVCSASGNPTTKTIAVFPIRLHFVAAECFCQDLGGHLAKIENVNDYRALENAVRLSGVDYAVFIGTHEISEGSWANTDDSGTVAGSTVSATQLQFLSSKGWCETSRLAGKDVSAQDDCTDGNDNGIATNNGQNEDTLAYCGVKCTQSIGTQDHMMPGLHDWGNSVAQDTFLYPACSFDSSNNPPLNDSPSCTRCPHLECPQTQTTPGSG